MFGNYKDSEKHFQFLKNLGVIGSSVRWVETLRTTEWNTCQTGRS